MFDSHLHSANSPDSKTTVEELCLTALERGMSGIALTDHMDMGGRSNSVWYRHLQGSVADATRASRDRIGELRVLRGVELGSFPDDPEGARLLLSMCDLDVVLGSVHWVRKGFAPTHLYRADYAALGEERCYELLGAYLSLVYETAVHAPVDVIAHLSYPLRYMNGRYGVGVDILRFEDRLSELFSVMIERGIALEVNTASLDSLIFDFVPDRDVLSLYRSLGGRLLTIGSDAHIAASVGKGFVEAKTMLRSLGFSEYHYYVSHQPIAVSLG